MQKWGRLPKGIGLNGVITGYSRDIYPITPVSHYTSIICWLYNIYIYIYSPISVVQSRYTPMKYSHSLHYPGKRPQKCCKDTPYTYIYMYLHMYICNIPMLFFVWLQSGLVSGMIRALDHVYMYIYIYMYICIYVYMYIYIRILSPLMLVKHQFKMQCRHLYIFNIFEILGWHHSSTEYTFLLAGYQQNHGLYPTTWPSVRLSTWRCSSANEWSYFTIVIGLTLIYLFNCIVNHYCFTF